MPRSLRWIGIAMGSLIALGALGYVLVYGLSERMWRRTYEVPAASLTIPTDSDAIREGQRLATIRGCLDCHGKKLRITVLANCSREIWRDDPRNFRIIE